MQAPNPVALCLAPTGMVTTSNNSRAPLQPREIIREVLECAEIGITSVHVHARDADDAPTSDPAVYGEIIEGIRAGRPDLLIGVSLSGRSISDPELRARPLEQPPERRPDFASLTTSSVNFTETASVNSPKTVRYLAARIQKAGIKAEVEAFDLGMINSAHRLHALGLLPRPWLVNMFFGNLASAQPTLPEMAAMLSALPDDAVWNFAGIGRAQNTAAGVAVATGGGVRIGVEDNLWFDDARTQLATNHDLVRRVHAMADAQGRQIMTPAQMRERLGRS